MFKPVGLFMCVRYEVVSLDRYLPIGFWPVDSGTLVGFLLRCVIFTDVFMRPPYCTSASMFVTLDLLCNDVIRFHGDDKSNLRLESRPVCLYRFLYGIARHVVLDIGKAMIPLDSTLVRS